MLDTFSTLMIILTVAAVTFLIRSLPFLLWRGGRDAPGWVLYLGRALPPAVMAMLIVYCLKAVNVLTFPFGLPELIACAAVVALHLWKRNNLISILGGTALYMILVQTVFAH